MLEKNIEVDDEFGLLDLAVVAAENWVLLVVAPIAATLATLAILYFATPQTFDSTALLRLTPPEAALLRTARTLAPAIVGTDYLNEYDGSFSRAVENLADDRLTVTREGDTELYRVSVQDKSAQGAQHLLTRITDSLIANSTPTASEAALLALRIEQTKRSIEELNLSLERTNRLADNLETATLASGATLGEIGQTTVALLASIEERHLRLFQLEESLKGSVSREDILQPPTLPDSPNARSILVRAVSVGFGAGLAAFVFALASAGWKGASRSADGLTKITRIRRAFGLQPKV